MKIASKSNAFTNTEPLRVPIVEAQPEELQPFHLAKNDFFSTKPEFSSYTKIGKLPEIIIVKIKADTPEPQTHLIPEVEKLQKSDIGVKITGANKYKTSSSTKRVNYVTTFKNAPNMFKMDVAEKIRTHIGTDYLA